jgi:hypothetical protein
MAILGPIVTQPRQVGDAQWGSEALLVATQPAELVNVKVDVPMLWSVECVDLFGAGADATFLVQVGMPSGVRDAFTFLVSTTDDPRLFRDESRGIVRLVVWGTSVQISAQGTLGGGRARAKVAPLGAGDAAAASALSPLLDPNKVADAASRSDVGQSAVDVTLIPAANGGGSHRGCTIWNDAAANLRVRLGTGAASATDFSFIIAPQSYWEMPFPFYIGEIHGIWDAAGAGAARITQLKEA